MTDATRSHPVEILLVEDSPGDVRLTKEALKDGKVCNRLTTVEDGVEAMAYLRRQGSYANAPRPDLVLLDLNLPKMDGREVLSQIKSDPNLCRIPVVVLTTSTADEDIIKTYEQHANCYISKPLGFHKLIEVVRAIESFWLSVVRLPPD